MSKRSYVLGLVALSCIAIGTQTLQAAMVSNLFVTGANQASDEDRLYLIDRDYQSPADAGRIDVGDSLRGLVNFNTLNDSSANLGGDTANNEWTGVYQIRVKTKVSVADGFGGFNYAFEFEPDPDFENAYGVGAMMVMFEDSVHNFASDFDDPTAGAVPWLADDVGVSGSDLSIGPYQAEEAFIDTATDGSRFWTLGFTDFNGNGSSIAGAGQGWYGLHFSSDNISLAFGLPTGNVFAGQNWGLDRIDNQIAEVGDPVRLGDTVGPLGLNAHFIGSTTLRGIADLDTAFEASSDTNVTFMVTEIPAPTTLLVIAMGSFWVVLKRHR